MASTPEVIQQTLTMDTTEQTIGTTGQWWPMVDVYVNAQGVAAARGAKLRVWALVDGEKVALLGEHNLNIEEVPQRIMSVRGAGDEIRATIQGVNGTSLEDVSFGLVGYDPTYTNAYNVAEDGADNTLAVDSFTQDASIDWAPLVDAMVDGVGEPNSKNSMWVVYAVLGSGEGAAKYQLTRQLYETAAIADFVGKGIVAGCTSFELWGKSGPSGTSEPTGVLVGYQAPTP
jgi:hypothetical protein